MAARAMANGPRLMVAAGGDGTVNVALPARCSRIRSEPA